MTEEQNNTLRKEIEDLCERYGVKLEEISQMITLKNYKERNKKLKKEVESNKQYVGQTFRQTVEPYHGMFPKMSRYYKIISERSESSNKVSCLVFDEIPHYWFEYQAHKASMSGDYYLGEFDFSPIWTENIPVLYFKQLKMEKIDQASYNLALSTLTDRISKLEWIPDHHRMGGVLPGTDKWKQNDTAWSLQNNMSHEK